MASTIITITRGLASSLAALFWLLILASANISVSLASSPLDDLDDDTFEYGFLHKQLKFSKKQEIVDVIGDPDEGTFVIISKLPGKEEGEEGDVSETIVRFYSVEKELADIKPGKPFAIYRHKGSQILKGKSGFFHATGSTPAGKKFVLAADHGVKFFDVHNLEKLRLKQTKKLKPYSKNIYDVLETSFTRDQGFIVFSHYDINTYLTWMVESLPVAPPIHSGNISPDGKHILSIKDYYYVLVSYGNDDAKAYGGSELTKISIDGGKNTRCRSGAFDVNSQYLFLCDPVGAVIYDIKELHLQGKKDVLPAGYLVTKGDELPLRFDFHPKNSKLVLVATGSGSYLYKANLPGGEAMVHFHYFPESGARFSPDGTMILTPAKLYRTSELLNLGDAELANLGDKASYRANSSVTFINNGKAFLTHSEHSVNIFVSKLGSQEMAKILFGQNQLLLALLYQTAQQKGEKGEQGPRGFDGLKGVPGPEGPKGEKGEKGESGDQGLIGRKGENGHRGPPGFNGEPGPKGPKGPRGPRGPRGKKGEPRAPQAPGPAPSANNYEDLSENTPSG